MGRKHRGRTDGFPQPADKRLKRPVPAPLPAPGQLVGQALPDCLVRGVVSELRRNLQLSPNLDEVAVLNEAARRLMQATRDGTLHVHRDGDGIDVREMAAVVSLV